jgi:hypothetical protein
VSDFGRYGVNGRSKLEIEGKNYWN